MKKTIRILVPVLLTVLILLSIAWYLFSYDREFTRDTLLQQARFQDSHGNSRISSVFYNLAYGFSDRDESVAIELASQYKADGNYTKAEYTLTHAINSAPTKELYIALCRTFVEQNKLLDAVSLLENIIHSDIKAELDAMRPKAPTADYAPGYYSQYMDLSLSSDGTILYTTDGTYPSTQGPVYSAPLALPAGETTIYAISVANNGLVSPATVLGYTITGIIEEVTFADAAMEAAIRELIQADTDDTVYTNQLWEITEFTVPDATQNLVDLQQLPYLKTLLIQNQTLTGLEELSSLHQLETLDLTGSRFPTEDLSILAAMPTLSKLVLNDCALSTIADLSGAPALNVLDLSNNTIRNLDPLSPMLTLRELNLQHNAVTDLSALKDLSELEKLDVSFNALTSLTPISSCAKLNWLGADNNQVKAINGLEYLPLLSYLSLDNNKLQNIAVLAYCPELTSLSIAGNSIEEITHLSALTKLTYFDFSNNKKIAELPVWPDGCPLETINGSYNSLESIDSLKNMQSLATINMDYNLLTNIDALADNFCLVQVNVYGNEIEDVSALRDHDIIVNYDPTNK